MYKIYIALFMVSFLFAAKSFGSTVKCNHRLWYPGQIPSAPVPKIDNNHSPKII